MAKKTEIKTKHRSVYPKSQNAGAKIEREYVIPLRVEWKKVPRYKRAKKAIKAIREFLVKHMKIYDRDLNKIKIDQYLNEFVWFRGIRKPPAKIKVKAIREGEIVKVELVNILDKFKFKKLRAEKLESKSKEAKEKKKSLKEKVQESIKGKPKEDKKVEEVDEKKVEEEKEKKSAVVEEGQKLEKQQAKAMKSQVGGKEKKKTQPRRMALQK